MKRTPLRRKTPLAPGTGGLKRTPLAKRSKKKDRVVRTTSPARKQYLERHACALCGGVASEVHEIARGPSRDHAYSDADGWLAVCRSCHEQLGDYQEWPVPKQIARKMLLALEGVNAAREGRPQSSLAEVLRHLRSLASRSGSGSCSP